MVELRRELRSERCTLFGGFAADKTIVAEKLEDLATSADGDAEARG